MHFKILYLLLSVQLCSLAQVMLTLPFKLDIQYFPSADPPVDLDVVKLQFNLPSEVLVQS